MSRLIALGLVLATAFAGCLQLPDDAADAADVDIDPATGGSMSAKEVRKDDVGLCTENLGIGGSNDDRFCATRTITVDGALAGFRAMDVSLDTFNGDIDILESAEGKWGFVATLKARGASAEAASATIDEIDFAWSHEDGSGHFVDVAAHYEGQANNVQAEIELRMPRSVLLTVVGDTSNGDITLTGSRSEGLALDTSNGDIVAKGASVGQVSLTTSNGEIEAELTPISSGRWNLDTSNGDITLAVPEGATYGYSIEGSTSNGEVTYTLRDGEKGPCPEGSEYYTPPCNERTFETTSFVTRATKVTATLDTSNGEISAGPA